MWPRKKNTRGGDDTIADVMERSMSKAKGADIARELRDEAVQDRGEGKLAEGDFRLDRDPEALRYRRRPRAEDAFSMSGTMPGSMPGVSMEIPP
jgi:maintenance of morphology protein 1